MNPLPPSTRLLKLPCLSRSPTSSVSFASAPGFPGSSGRAYLVSLALRRARMCEVLGGSALPDERETLFTIGLFSVADALLDCPMAEPWAGSRPPVLAGGDPWRTNGDTVERLELLARALVAGERQPDPRGARGRRRGDGLRALDGRPRRSGDPARRAPAAGRPSGPQAAGSPPSVAAGHRWCCGGRRYRTPSLNLSNKPLQAGIIEALQMHWVSVHQPMG